MIPKSGCRFSEKIMLKHETKAKWRFSLISFRFRTRAPFPCLVAADAYIDGLSPYDIPDTP